MAGDHIPLEGHSTKTKIRVTCGLLFAGCAILLGFSILSFFNSGAADQSILFSNSPGEKVQNICGRTGANLGQFFVSNGYGYLALCIPLFLAIWTLKLLRIGRFHVWKWFLFLGFAMIWGSLFLAFIECHLEPFSFFPAGGLHGQHTAQWLYLQIGWPGIIIILSITAFMYLFFLSKQTIYWMRRIKQTGKTLFGKRQKTTVENETVENEKTGGNSNNTINSITNAHSDDSPVLEIVGNTNQIDTLSQAEPDEKEQQEEEYELIIEQGTSSGEASRSEPDIMTSLVSTERYNPRLGLEHYKFPDTDLLKEYPNEMGNIDNAEQNRNIERIRSTLNSFGIEIERNIKATVGPTVTLYELIPKQGIRISKIRGLEDDIALSLSALGIRIIAPMPGQGTIGIEVPNERPRIVSMRNIISSNAFQNAKYELPIALGRTITDEVYMFDLCKMPHLLVAGATGQGKSVGLNAIITSLLYKKHPAELKFVLIDPKKVEFSVYSGIERNFLAKLPDEEEPIITDVSRVIQTLNSVCTLMDTRYDLLKRAHARNVKEYNEKFLNRHLNPNNGHEYMPYIVVIIDEFGDLIMTAGREVEHPITRIAQLARAVGIHMVIATQRPTTNIITGTIKANFPARMAFRVTTGTDSRTILDRPGANQLIGKGDMLFMQGSEPVRVQCAFVDTPEVEQVNGFILEQQQYPNAYELPECKTEESTTISSGSVDVGTLDPLFEEAARLLVIHQQGSASLIQRKFSIGYNRAGRLIDQLEKNGIVGPSEGSKPREVLFTDELSLNNRLASIRS